MKLVSKEQVQCDAVALTLWLCCAWRCEPTTFSSFSLPPSFLYVLTIPNVSLRPF